ncbi:MAG: competence/damage-inducible protein A [Candidatus Omnitrophota bacterium]
MTAEIVAIGTELLLGHVVNTNAAFLSQKLAEAGIDVFHHTTVGDNPGRLTEAIRKALGRSDVVITSGGLGPTVDDITIETIAKLTGRELILDRAVLKDLNGYFKLRRIKAPRDSIRQAYIPEGAKRIRNRVGTAPGLIVEVRGKVIIALPGPPREIEPMVEHEILPYLLKHYALNPIPYTLRSRTIKLTGLAESQVNAKAKDLLSLKPPTTVGIYAKLGEVDLKIMAKADSDREAARVIGRIEGKIHSRLRGNIFGYDEDTLEGAVANALKRKKLTIATAESCTGGFVSHRITNVSGSSGYFMMGIIAYSNESKVNMLGVSPFTLKKYGAVSREVALEMAEGVRRLAGTDIGLSLTGIAGPTGGTKSKPIGLVYIALAMDDCKKLKAESRKLKALVKEFRFKGTREEIKFQASQAALELVRRNV